MQASCAATGLVGAASSVGRHILDRTIDRADASGHGGPALGVFEDPEDAPFDHAVALAYFWPSDLLAAYVEQAGFVVTDTRTRSDSGANRHSDPHEISSDIE